MIPRIIYEKIKRDLFKGKAIILVGPRQVGKTTLLQKLQNEYPGSLFLDCDEPDIRRILEDSTSTQLKNLIGNAKLVIIDEAQRVKNIGLTLKLIIDRIKEVQLIASGSSSLELANSNRGTAQGLILQSGAHQSILLENTTETGDRLYRRY